MSKIDKNGKNTISNSTTNGGGTFTLKEGKDNSITKSSSNYHSSSGVGLGIFKVIIVLLILVVFYRFLRTGQTVDFSFKTLIEILADAPVIDFGLADFNFKIVADLGWANIFRDYINLFADLWSLLLSLVNMIWQGLVFLFYIIRSLFVL